MRIKRLLTLTVLGLATQAGATTWIGANAVTDGYGVHAGTSLLSVPFLGRIGVEGAAEKRWNTALPNRYAVGVTLRDLNIPLTRVDAFATLGAEYTNDFRAYAEGGLRGSLLGPAGWRAFVRGNTTGQFGAGLGLELRF